MKIIYAIEIHIGIDNLLELEHEWDSLFKSIKSPRFTQSFDWQYSFLKFLARNPKEYFYITVSRGDRIVGIFPLRNYKRKFYFLSFRVLGFSEHNHCGLESFLIHRNEKPKELFYHVYSYLKTKKEIKWDLFYLQRVLEGSNEELCYIDDKEVSFRTRSTECFNINVKEEKGTLSKLSSKTKSRLRNKLRRLEELGNLEFKSTRDPSNLEVYLNDFLFVESSGWKGVSGTKSAIGLNSNLVKFYNEILLRFGQKRQIELSLIYLDDKPIAAQFLIILKPTVYLLKLGYVEKYKSYSLGHLLMRHNILRFENDPEIKDYNLVSNATWFNTWKPRKVNCYNNYVCRNTFILNLIKAINYMVKAAKGAKNYLSKDNPLITRSKLNL